MKALVIGSGRIGQAIVYDLAQSPDVGSIGIADNRKDFYNEVKDALNSPQGDKKFLLQHLDIQDEKKTIELMMEHDIVISSAPYHLNSRLTEMAIEAGRHYVDLGSDEEIEAYQFRRHTDVKAKDLTFIPSCGVAPGLAAVLIGAGMQELDETDTAEVFVGGLPKYPEGALDYSIVYSPETVIDLYNDEVGIIRDGKVRSVAPLSELEGIHINGQFFEAFLTAYASLHSVLDGKVKNFHEKNYKI